MSDSTNRGTHDDETLRRMGVRYVIERAGDGTVTPRDLGEPTPATDAAALSLQLPPECPDCSRWQEEIDETCALFNDGGHSIVYLDLDGRRCVCRCP